MYGVCPDNQGSFGCEVVARVLGQLNVPECGLAISKFVFCLYAAKILLSICRCVVFLL